MNSIIFSASPEELNYYAQKNYGVYRAASEIRKQGVSCQVVQFFNKFDDEELVSIINSFSNLKIVGFSTMFWEYYDSRSIDIVVEKTNFIIDHLRQHYPEVKIISGGSSSRIFLEQKFKKIDSIFEWFSENDLIPYIRNIAYKEPKLIPNVFERDISIYNNIYGNFDFTYSDTIYTPKDVIANTDVPILEVGRGCIFKCKFCGFALNGKKKFDYIKNADILKNELVRNYENFGVTNYILSDDTFNDSPQKVEFLHKLFTELPFKIRFACYLRLDLLLRFPDEIKQLKEMGLIGAFFGIETFHKQAAKLIGKGIDPDVAKTTLNRLKLNDWGDDVKIAIGLITGLPYETYDSIEQTKDWLADDKNLVDQVVPFPLGVRNPATNTRPQSWDSEFQKNAEKYGFFWPEGDTHNWHNKIGPVTSRYEAVEIWEDYKKVISKTCRQKQGGFNLLKAYPLISSQKNSPSIEELIAMDRYTYTSYVKNIEKTNQIEKDYINKYKSSILNIVR
jgi:radical SAM superfamily enzyme YgiQ (UPF0313 family)